MYNTFFIGLPEIITFSLDVCAMYYNLVHGSGPTSRAIESGAICSAKQVPAGEYKFSILGLLSGTMVNTNDTQAAANERRGNKNYVNVRDYKKLHYRQILNVENMG